MSSFELLFAPESIRAASEISIKLIIGLLLGGLIGYERELHGHPAGIRTHMMVVLGCMVFTEVSRAFSPGDPGRVAAQVVTGIGFLGAGAIIRVGTDIKGLTTAASIWSVAAIGMAASMGGVLLWIAVVATALALMTLTLIDNLERRFMRHGQIHTMRVQLASFDALGEVVDAIQTSGSNLKGLRIIERNPATVDLEIQKNRLEALAKVVAISKVTQASLLE